MLNFFIKQTRSLRHCFTVLHSTARSIYTAHASRSAFRRDGSNQRQQERGNVPSIYPSESLPRSISEMGRSTRLAISWPGYSVRIQEILISPYLAMLMHICI